ncbi:MAG: hypothetical protein JKX81_01610 [Arenicella sp.]|nr:hypothetical protein [Arenicella sp.]
MTESEDYPTIGADDIGVINEAGENVRIVAFMSKPFAWKVIEVAADGHALIDASSNYSAEALTNDAKSNVLQLELPAGDYELTSKFILQKSGRPPEYEGFHFMIPAGVLQMYLSRGLVLYISRAGERVIPIFQPLTYNLIGDISLGVYIGCVPTTVIAGEKFDEADLISNKASVQPGETIKVWKDAQGAIQITPADAG